MDFDPTAFEHFDLGRLEEAADDADGGGDEGDDDSRVAVGAVKGGAQSLTLPKQAVLFVVHVTKDVFDQVADENSDGCGQRSIFREVMLGVAAFFRSRIVATTNDKIAVVFFGTSFKNNDLDLPGLYTLLDLNFPDARRIKTLEETAKLSFSDFCAKFGEVVDSSESPDADEPASLADLFWLCNQTFVTKSNTRNLRNRVMIFTTDSNPCRGQENLKMSSVQRAKDLQNDLADLELFPLDTPGGQPFDLNAFWAEILMVDEADIDSYQETSRCRLEEIRTKLRAKEHAQRVLGRMNFTVADGVEIAVGMFTSTMQTKAPYPVYLDANDNRLLKSETKQICVETGSLLGPDQIKKYVPYGGTKVFITPEKKKEVMTFPDVEVGIKLLGFKPISHITVEHNIKHPYFIYPLEAPPYGVKGCSSLVQALILRMSQREEAAIVRWVPRANAAVRFAALLAQMHVEDESGSQVTPAGFHLVPLPFAGDIRDLDISASRPPKRRRSVNAVGQASPRRADGEEDDNDEEIDDIEEGDQKLRQAVDKVKLLLRGLTFEEGFRPEDIDNPSLQKHYAGVEALAMGETDLPEIEDCLQPDVETMTCNLKPVVDSWRDLVYPSGTSASTPPRTAGKAKAKPAAGAGGAKKRASPGKSGSKGDVKTALENGEDLEVFTVGLLKEHLAVLGLPVSGRKSDLIDRLEKHTSSGRKRKRVQQDGADDD